MAPESRRAQTTSNVQTAPPPFLWEGRTTVTLASGDDVKQLLQAIPSECRPEVPQEERLLMEVDVDALASSKDEGDLPADAVVKRSVATGSTGVFAKEARPSVIVVKSERRPSNACGTTSRPGLNLKRSYRRASRCLLPEL